MQTQEKTAVNKQEERTWEGLEPPPFIVFFGDYTQEHCLLTSGRITSFTL
jgi:hypothetical protein